MTIENASEELRAIVEGGGKHQKMMNDYSKLRAIVGGEGASERFAARMVEELQNNAK